MGRIVTISDSGGLVPAGVAAPGLVADGVAGGRERAPSVTMSRDAGLRVTGGALERMPLAAVAGGLVQRAEIWSLAGPNAFGAVAGAALAGRPAEAPLAASAPGLARRWFRVAPGPGPRRSDEMAAHLAATGAPDILCVWGEGVDHGILDAARGAVTIYASLAPEPLRIPDDLAARFDIVLAGCDGQSAELRARLPGALCPVMPLGPEFASDEDFRPLGTPPDVEAVLVARAGAERPIAALAALAGRPGRRVLALAEDAAAARALRRAAEGLRLDLVVEERAETPAALNRQLNRARAALVLEPEEGAPALLTQAMLAGLPVLVAEDLPCGLQYVLPGTGRVAPVAAMGAALDEILGAGAGAGPAGARAMDPRAEARARWTWPHTVRRLGALVDEARARRRAAA